MTKKFVLNLALFLYKETEYWVGQNYLRDKARALMEDIVSEFILWEHSNPKETHLSHLRSLVSELKETLVLARNRELISRENYLLVVKELDNLLKDIERNTLASSPSRTKRKEEKESTKDALVFTQKTNQSSLSERQRKILDIVKEKKMIQVSQLQPYFPGITKRTLRRDLRALLEKGFLKRKGEGSSVTYLLSSK